ncbi:hypothetical protein JBE04_29225 [Streptomyces sp. PRKS01-29]|nr:hypothetical protein [Streptomyces sabulosicollis]MBI0298435.1 hypothetical protein [Streptomyces sabulosicollis]
MTDPGGSTDEYRYAPEDRDRGGAHLSGSTSPGGTVRLNNLSIGVRPVSGHKAKLVLSS